MGRFKHVILTSRPKRTYIGQLKSCFKVGTEFVAEELNVFDVKLYRIAIKNDFANIPVEYFEEVRK